MYLDDSIVYDCTHPEHVSTIRAFLMRLRQHNLKFSPSNARINATNIDFLGHTMSLSGVQPD